MNLRGRGGTFRGNKDKVGNDTIIILKFFQTRTLKMAIHSLSVNK